MHAVPLFAFDLAAYRPYLPLAVGCAVAAVCGVVGLVVVKRNARRNRPLPAARGSGSWEDIGASAADRRESVRRDGQAVRVFVTATALPGQTTEGWVLDRSTGGLRLALDHPVPAGSYLQIRAENAPDTVPWVAIEVRSQKRVGDHYEHGCAFEQTPPWNVLLLFG